MKYRIKVHNYSTYTVYRKSFLFWKLQGQTNSFTLVDSKIPAKFSSMAQAVNAIKRTVDDYKIEYIFTGK